LLSVSLSACGDVEHEETPHVKMPEQADNALMAMRTLGVEEKTTTFFW
jgi:hypothetical protein